MQERIRQRGAGPAKRSDLVASLSPRPVAAVSSMITGSHVRDHCSPYNGPTRPGAIDSDMGGLKRHLHPSNIGLPGTARLHSHDVPLCYLYRILKYR